MIEPNLSRRGLLKAGALITVAPSPHRAGRAADTIVVNGKVLVMDGKRRRAQAVAIRDGRIHAVGSNRDITRLAGRGTQFVDAAGGTVLPGINDGHLHFNGFGMEAGLFGFDAPPFVVNVAKPTAAAIAAAVAQGVVAADGPDAWIRGSGWNGNILDRLPTRDVLDPVSAGHPVILSDFSHHACAVNTAALRLAGITRDTVAPDGGVIEKDAAGEPNGILREGAMGLVARIVPPYTRDQLSTAMDSALTAIHSLGITSLTDPGVSLDTVALYAEKHLAGELPLRINLMLAAGTSVESLTAILDGYRAVRGVDPRWLRIAEVKISGDGIPTEAQTAWLHEPYVDGRNGTLNVAGDTIRQKVATLHTMIGLAARRGFQLGTHATGDATIDAVVAGYLATRSRALRHYVIHGDLTPAATLRTMARNDIGVSFNPSIKFLLGRTLDASLGPARVDYQWPFRSALDAGVRASSASDAAVVTPDWLVGVAGAVTREGMYGGVAGIEQAITVEEALVSYTRTPAWQDHAETWKGTLQENHVADLCIVGGDLLGVDPHDIPALRVTTTMVGGEVMYDSTSSSGRAAVQAAARVKAYRHDRSVDCLRTGTCCCKINDLRLDRVTV